MAASILQELAAASRARVDAAKLSASPSDLHDQALDAASAHQGSRPFFDALAAPKLSFICECKKASPSKGVIAEHFPYVQIARDYEAAGADAISVLTEPTRFLGKLDYLREISQETHIPTLRKDFIVDAYQIDEAAVAGAAAVLLICAILDEKTLAAFIAHADEVGLSALVEAHDEGEVQKALRAGARIIGVNNRNLNNFTVNFDNALALRKAVPKDVLFVAESGVKGPDDVAVLAKTGADAVLVGEALMRATDKAGTLASFKQAAARAVADGGGERA
ncbi:MAG: indole-3-glycerol phosphate synthase TrpC [Coriobacteriales bacterium]|jgi:indole-3-glycerol phosphate synthase